MSKKLKVSFFSSSRADYGLLRPLLSICNEDPRIDAGIIVSGSHLIKSHGYTVKEIMNDKFFIQSKIKINIPFDSLSLPPYSVIRYANLSLYQKDDNTNDTLKSFSVRMDPLKVAIDTVSQVFELDPYEYLGQHYSSFFPRRLPRAA